MIFSAFWHGRPLRALNWACLASFIHQGHQVDLYAYQALDCPSGVNLRDAKEILSEDYLFFFNNPNLATPDVAPFADLFRLKLLLTRGGWWIDADVICNQSIIPDCRYAWARESFADDAYIGNSQIRFPENDAILHKMYEQALRLLPNLSLREEIGPKLLTRVLGNEDPPADHFGSTPAFYPLAWVEAFKLWLPAFRDEIATRTRHAVFLPCWASLLSYMGIDPDRMPPPGSYISAIFEAYLPDGRGLRPAYDADEIASLARAWIGKWGWALAEIRTLTAPSDLARLGL